MKWIKRSLQLFALIFVIWGIVQTFRKSTAELQLQQAEIAKKVEELQQKADEAGASGTRDSLLAEASDLQEQVNNFWKASPAGLCVACVVYALGMLPASLYWRQCLVAMQQNAPTSAVLFAYFYGNLGKYFPGKALVIVIRLAVLSPFGIKKVATSITIFMETLTLMAVGGAVSAGCLIVLNIDWRLTGVAVLLLLSTFAPTIPQVLRLVVAKLQKGVEQEKLDEWISQITWRQTLKGWCYLALTWLGFGGSLWFVVSSLYVSELAETPLLNDYLSVYAACGLAVVLGFVSLIPGGAGVREAVLSLVLSPVIGPVGALCAALWMRVVWLVTELLMAGLTGLVYLWKKKQQPITSASS